MKKNTLWLIITLLFALLAIYTGYKTGFDISFSLNISKSETSVNGSMTFLFTILTVFGGIKYLTCKFTK
ncbi:MAG: hypothetical protein WBP82_10580 [Leuconostoc mesenteroides]